MKAIKPTVENTAGLAAEYTFIGTDVKNPLILILGSTSAGGRDGSLGVFRAHFFWNKAAADRYYAVGLPSPDVTGHPFRTEEYVVPLASEDSDFTKADAQAYLLSLPKFAGFEADNYAKPV